ncbi:hypothetical protein ACFVVA_16680 [Kitasatospora sp. NPDC058048]|uniref:hypothetical protein n=1 Tax=Kitasatospora sp. NPDC058048 TaxID=3346313 RepID=UPI0036DC17B1
MSTVVSAPVRWGAENRPEGRRFTRAQDAGAGWMGRLETLLRDSFSDGFLTRLAHDRHLVDLMCLYLLHGSVERIPGLLVDRETLSFEYLSRHVRTESRSSHGDADLFSLWIRKKVRGRLYGLEFRVYFIAGEPCADAVIPFGAPVGLPRFMHHLRGCYGSGGAPGDWDFDVYTDVRDLRESVVLFGNRREVWFQVNRGPVVAGGSRLISRNRGRLVTGRLHGNQFGTNAQLHAGGVLFPDRLAAVEGVSAEARAYQRYVARLRDPLPSRAGRSVRPEFGATMRRRSVN